jgi:hypothetical protein
MRDNASAIAVRSGRLVAAQVFHSQVRRAVAPAISDRDDVPDAGLLVLDRVAAPATRGPVTGEQVGAHASACGIARSQDAHAAAPTR